MFRKVSLPLLQSCLPSSLDHRNDNSQSIFGWIWNFWQQWLTHCQPSRHGPLPSCIRCSWTHLATVRCIGRYLSIYRHTLQTKIRQQIPNNDKDLWICKQFKTLLLHEYEFVKTFPLKSFLFSKYMSCCIITSTWNFKEKRKHFQGWLSW